jgi:hypothetical protein
MEDVSRLIRFEHSGGAPKAYFFANAASAVIMPLVDVVDAQRGEESAHVDGC